MGTSRSAAELARKLNAAGTTVVRANRTQVERVAIKVKRTAESERNRAVGSDGRMSNVGRNGARLGVRYDLSGNLANPSAVVRATGPWQLVENPSRPHVVTSRYAGSTRARRSRAGIAGPVQPGALRGGRRAVILTPWGYKRHARHPGTRGKRPWHKAIDRAGRNLKDEVATPIRDGLRAVFR